MMLFYHGKVSCFLPRQYSFVSFINLKSCLTNEQLRAISDGVSLNQLVKESVLPDGNNFEHSIYSKIKMVKNWSKSCYFRIGTAMDDYLFKTCSQLATLKRVVYSFIFLFSWMLKICIWLKSLWLKYPLPNLFLCSTCFIVSLIRQNAFGILHQKHNLSNL